MFEQEMVSMLGKITSAEDLSYARVRRLGIASEQASIEVEIPIRVLQEANFPAREGVSVEFEVSREAGSIDEWLIVMSGEVYLKKEKGGIVYSSLGGLRLVIRSEDIYRDLKVGDKIYFKLRAV